MKDLFVNIILLILSLLLAVVLFPIGWLHGLITLRLSISRLSHYLLTISLSIDQMGNVILAPLFNRIMIKRNGYKFGDEDETISYVLGRNQITETLSKCGNLLANLLDWIDPNHCVKTVLIVWRKGKKYCGDKPYLNKI
ncbi:MAG: hypothetical protein RLZZ175_3407 [Bacteroidota bacterium]|jgi:8-oxo-dGTP diphosphatase